MKKIAIKTSLVSGLLLVSAAHTGTVAAHEFLGGLGTLKGSAATDVFVVNCEADAALSNLPTHHLRIAIRDDTAGGAIISAQAINTPLVSSNITTSLDAINVTDLIGADGVASVAKTLNLPTPAVNATYNILVNHTASASESYMLSYHCEDVNNAHTGTADINLLQQQ